MEVGAECIASLGERRRKTRDKKKQESQRCLRNDDVEPTPRRFSASYRPLQGPLEFMHQLRVTWGTRRQTFGSPQPHDWIIRFRGSAAGSHSCNADVQASRPSSASSRGRRFARSKRTFGPTPSSWLQAVRSIHPKGKYGCLLIAEGRRSANPITTAAANPARRCSCRRRRATRCRTHRQHRRRLSSPRCGRAARVPRCRRPCGSQRR